MQTVDVGGRTIAYERAGSGRPLVLLHGYVGDATATWEAQLEGLSNDFTVVAWDAPGAGLSPDPPVDFGMAGYADCLAHFIAALDLDKPHICGLSFGGALAIEFAHRYPEVPASLVLVSAYAGWGGSLPPEQAKQRLDLSLRLADCSPDEFASTLMPTMFTEGTPREAVDRFARSVRAFHPQGFRAMTLASAEDLRDALPQLRVPTLLIYGDRDVRAPMFVAEHLRTAISGAELKVLSGTGHVCNIEAPDRFNAAVRHFLAG